jgi:DNA polymerase III sliding clamp (beta) subunit (PCNA family)
MSDDLTIDPKLLAKVLRIMRTHTSKDESRPHLRGTVIHSDDRGVRMASTDGHRLAVYILSDTPIAWQGKTILTPGARRMLRSLCFAANGFAIDLDLGARRAREARGGLTFGWDECDYKFPEYEKIIPKKAELASHAVVDPKFLRDACNAFDVLADVRSGVSVRTAKDHPLEVTVLQSPYVKSLIVLVMPMRVSPGWDDVAPFQAPLDRFLPPEATPAPMVAPTVDS